MSITKERGIKVGKFGGTSMATPDRVRNAVKIIRSNPNRRVTTVSAPGNGEHGDLRHNFRVTKALRAGEFDQVWERFDSDAQVLFGHDSRYTSVRRAIETSRRRAAATGISPYAESRGELIQGMITAHELGATFIDPTKAILLENDGTIHPDTYRRIRELIKSGRKYVFGGYFGANVNTGEVQLLPPGGTDLTGAILSKALGADVYENWTDIDGVQSADPRIVSNSKGIGKLTGDEMGEMGHRGAGILQVDAVEPVWDTGIPINIRNSFNPTHPGTLVVDRRISPPEERIIGIASREGFVSIEVAQAGMARRPGALAALTAIFADANVSLEQGPGGRNHVSFIAHSDQFTNEKDQLIMRRIRKEIRPTRLSLVDNLGLVAVVGQRLTEDATHVNAEMYPALSRANIKTGAHISSIEPNSIVFSVSNRDVNRTVNVLYDTFIR